MRSFAFTLYIQCCRRHVVARQVVSDISVVQSCWSICSLCSQSNNTNLLLRLLIAVLYGYFASHSKHTLTYNMAACGGHWPQKENLVTSLHPIYIVFATWKIASREVYTLLPPELHDVHMFCKVEVDIVCQFIYLFIYLLYMKPMLRICNWSSSYCTDQRFRDSAFLSQSTVY